MTQTKESLIEEFRIQTIQEAAMRVIAKKGISAATMNEIADEAGIAKGTIYLYFQNRDELLDKVAEFAISKLNTRLVEACAGAQGFDKQFRAMVETAMEFFDANSQFFRVYASARFPEAQAHPSHLECRRNERMEAHLQYVAQFLEQGMRDGKIRAADPTRLAIFLIEAVNSIIMLRLGEDTPPPLANDVDWIMSTILDGISKKRSRS
jgi:TetR/AcrR family fatty acid metabolism transcriptional regulator